jgi:alpha-L-rhamnosidase
VLGDGWFRGRLGWGGGRRNNYGDRLGLFAQLEIEYADGSRAEICTDDRWLAAKAPILSADLYDGEFCDARLSLDCWSMVDCDEHDWEPVEVREFDPAVLVAPDGPPVRRTQFLDPISVTSKGADRLLLDFGQNAAGRLRIRPEGSTGQVVTLRHAEVLDGGELAIRPLRTAQATDRYILRGDVGGEEWEPSFTYHGFRYAEVTGWPGVVGEGDIRAVVCHSDMERTGWFECSDPLINRLHENVLWSMRSNFLDIPTDTPQRDERLGYTGDFQVFLPTASFLYDCAGFASSWLRDLVAEQWPDGSPPVTVPDIQNEGHPLIAGWCDAAVIVPWTCYERFGDVGLLERQYTSMKAWVDGLVARSGGRYLREPGRQLGDWLDPTAPPGDPELARTDPHLVANAYFYRSADLLARAAGTLGFELDAEHYFEIGERIRRAFLAEYVSEEGDMSSDSQTAYAIGLEFGLLRELDLRERAGVRLIELVRENGFKIGTGFLGTPLILDALSGAGGIDEAYGILLQRELPSFLYPVTMGATTIWERWDSMRPDGSINPGEMTSFNTYAFGAVADWLHRTVAGIAPLEPGYRRILFAPRPGGGLTWASAAHETPYGRAEITWHSGPTLNIEVVVPPGCSAEIDLPGTGYEAHVEVGSGRYAYRVDPDGHPVPSRD